MRLIINFFCILIFLTTSALGQEEHNMVKDPENSIKIELKSGDVYIELLPDVAPGHVDRIKELAREGFYDGVPFHRVIDLSLIHI